jgi:hypothetical protein
LALIMAVLQMARGQMGWQNFTQEIIIGVMIIGRGIGQVAPAQERLNDFGKQVWIKSSSPCGSDAG